MQILQIPCRDDNYAILVHDTKQNTTILFDAPEHAPIEYILAKNGWQLDAILLTHYHFDHIEAAASLKAQYDCQIYGSKIRSETLEFVDHYIDQLKQINIGNIQIEIFQTPGHMPEHLCFYIQALKAAIVADVIFSLGCGRILNGSAEQLFTSIKLLKQLPDDTMFYCGHEYTQNNAKFATHVDPDNHQLQTRITEVNQLRANNLPTLPTLLSTEKATNPFLRYDDKAIRQHLNMSQASNLAIFAKLRQMKDSF